MGHLKLIILN